MKERLPIDDVAFAILGVAVFNQELYYLEPSEFLYRSHRWWDLVNARNQAYRVIQTLNNNPDKAVRLIPEVDRFLRWKSAPFVFFTNKDGRPNTGPDPKKFTTLLGREI